MKRGALLLGGLLLFCGTAQARTVVTTPGPYQRWVDESRMPTATESIKVEETRCPDDGSSECTHPLWDTVYFDRAGLRGYRPRLVFWHALGHRFDYQQTPRFRHRFRFIAGIASGVGWREQFGRYPNDTPSELFADSYAACSERHREYLPGLSWSQQRRVCQLIRAAA